MKLGMSVPVPSSLKNLVGWEAVVVEEGDPVVEL